MPHFAFNKQLWDAGRKIEDDALPKYMIPVAGLEDFDESEEIKEPEPEPE